MMKFAPGCLSGPLITILLMRLMLARVTCNVINTLLRHMTLTHLSCDQHITSCTLYIMTSTHTCHVIITLYHHIISLQMSCNHRITSLYLSCDQHITSSHLSCDHYIILLVMIMDSQWQSIAYYESFSNFKVSSI